MIAEQEGPAVAREQRRWIRILRGLDELDLARPQRLELALIEPRTQQRIGEQIDHQLPIARQELPRDSEGLRACAGAEAATHIGHRVGKLECIA